MYHSGIYIGILIVIWFWFSQLLNSFVQNVFIDSELLPTVYCLHLS